ncbi:MAG TPA: DUF4279 domain-containing protein [Gammaproteobacteria bacterium]|nr:DUF4279 domain-containing protein [Gammaproteobacteria bacterium]
MSPEHSVVLRLRHPNVDPAEITRRLGIAPQYAWRAGDPRLPEHGEEGRGVYRESCWVAVLSSASPLGELVDMVAARFAPRAVGAQPRFSPPATAELYFVLYKMKRTAAFWQELVAQGGTIDCLVQVVGAERFHLEMSPALLTLCAELRISLAIEVDGGAQTAVVAA